MAAITIQPEPTLRLSVPVDLSSELAAGSLGTRSGSKPPLQHPNIIPNSLALASALSTPSSLNPPSHISLTDIPSMLPLLTHNISLNPISTPITAFPLSWGEPLPPTLQSPDTILAADCCYFEPAFPLLLHTLERLLGGKEGAMCYFCFKKRRKADLGFVKMARKRFEVVEGGEDDPERGVWQREGIFLWVKTSMLCQSRFLQVKMTGLD